MHFRYQKNRKDTENTPIRTLRGKWIQLSNACLALHGCTPKVLTLMGGAFNIGGRGTVKQLGCPHRGHLKTERSAYYNCECHFPSTLYSFLGNEVFSWLGPHLGTILTCLGCVCKQWSSEMTQATVLPGSSSSQQDRQDQCGPRPHLKQALRKKA